jgi:hypothetical protein
VAQSAAATQASYQIATLKQERAQLSAEHDQLQAQLAADQAATRVAIAAQQLGMTQPSRWQFVKSATSPIALGPVPTTPATSGMWSHVLAVLGSLTGRPLAARTGPSR